MPLIAIVGGSGAGKTWLAEQLASALGSTAARVALDHFYRDLSHLPAPARAQTNFDHPDAVDWPKVQEVVEAIRHGRTTSLPAYDFSTHTRLPHSVPWIPRPVVIWEGLWLLLTPHLREQFSFSVFLECPVELRLARRCERDLRERGRSRESVTRQFHDHVMPMHEQFVAPQRRWAQCCLHSPVSEPAFLDLVRRVKELP